MKKSKEFIGWALDLLGLLLIGVILLVEYLHLSPGWEDALEIGVIIVVYGLIIAWWRAHPAAMVPPHSLLKPGDDGVQLSSVQARYRQAISIRARRKL